MQKIFGGLWLPGKKKQEVAHVLTGIAVSRGEAPDLPWDQRFFLSDRLVRYFFAGVIKQGLGVSEIFVIFH